MHLSPSLQTVSSILLVCWLPLLGSAEELAFESVSSPVWQPYRDSPLASYQPPEQHDLGVTFDENVTTASFSEHAAEFTAPRMVQADNNQCMYCKFGCGCVDADFISPRVWYLKNSLHGPTKKLEETDGFLLPHHYYRPVWRYGGNIYHDHVNFYSPKSLQILGCAVATHAVLANTSMDQNFRDWLQRRVGDNSEMSTAKALGETGVVVPVALGLWALDEWIDRRGWFGQNSVFQGVGGWARQTGRSLLVGAPMNYILQVGIGSSRPTDTEGSSKWAPFNDNNGSSGHAFVGAVPFLVAAKRTDNWFLKGALIFGSTLPGYSRLHDDAHYLSQVLLGYTVACLSVQATEMTNCSELQYRVVPISVGGQGFGMGVEFRR